MPRQSKAKNTGLQAKSSRASAIAYQKAIEATRREAAKQRRAFVRTEEKKLKGIARAVRGMGIYEPKSLEMTPYRKKRLRAVDREYGKFLDPSKFKLIPIPKADRKEAIQRADSLKIEHTRSGFIVPLEGHKKAELKRNTRGELTIVKKGKTKRGVNKGRIYTTVQPLADVSELEAERGRIKRAVKRLGRVTGKDKIVFVVKEDGTEGAGNMFFDDYEGLMKYLDEYKKNDAARINFYRHIHVYKMTIKDFTEKYPPKDRGVPRRLRFRGSGKFNTRRSK